MDPNHRLKWGPFGMNTRVDFGTMTDGSSNTIMLGERSSEPETGPSPEEPSDGRSDLGWLTPLAKQPGSFDPDGWSLV